MSYLVTKAMESMYNLMSALAGRMVAVAKESSPVAMPMEAGARPKKSVAERMERIAGGMEWTEIPLKGRASVASFARASSMG